MNLKPLQDRIIVKPVPEPETSAGGIILVEAGKEKPVHGQVIAVGQGKPLDNGNTRAPSLQVGDNVLFGQYTGTAITHEGEKVLIMREDEILAVIES